MEKKAKKDKRSKRRIKRRTMKEEVLGYDERLMSAAVHEKQKEKRNGSKRMEGR